MNREVVRSIGHELIGQQVKDRVTGRVGKLGAVYRYVNAFTGRVVRDEAHLRPADGSGWEWIADARNLIRADGDPEAKAVQRDG